MLVSIAILFGTFSLCISTLLVYSAIVVASRTQNGMQHLRVPATQDELRYASSNSESMASVASGA